MQHRDLFMDRAKGPATTPPKRGETSHISATFEEVIRTLADRQGITYEEALRKMRSKVTPHDA